VEEEVDPSGAQDARYASAEDAAAGPQVDAGPPKMQLAALQSLSEITQKRPTHSPTLVS